MPSDQDLTRQASRPARVSRRIPSSRIPPSDMGPYEGAERRGATLTNRLLVLGGAGVVAAAVTAGGILAARRLIRAIDGDEVTAKPAQLREQREHLAPRFASMDEEERDALRARARERARRDRNELARLRAQAARDRAAPRARARGGVAQELTDSATRLSGSLTGVVSSLTGALSGFRMVAAQASGIVREFSDAADVVRGVLNPKAGQPEDRRADQARVNDRDEPLRAEPRDRTHRL